ncbi:MAG: hypothetical protein HC852_05390 [Acaryochloridaceae cyanobacterium RU_4_10]|nr:hypothetical protein [Acaryochloridaceae cyanobacterium RU_4_10]
MTNSKVTAMAHGGKRTGAGRKSTWQSGRPFTETKLIRVPIAIAEQILEIAHRLDAGETFDLVTKSINKDVASATQPPSSTEAKKPVQKSLRNLCAELSPSGVNELSKYGWIQPKGAQKEHCFLKGKSLCGKWSYKGLSLHNRPNDYSSCRDCWVKYGKIVEKSEARKG